MELYLYIAFGFLGVLVILFLPPIMGWYWRLLQDAKGRISFLPQEHSNDIEKAHLLRDIRLAKERLDIISGSMDDKVWDKDIARALVGSLKKHPSLRVRILVPHPYESPNNVVLKCYEDTMKDPARVQDDLKDRWKLRFIIGDSFLNIQRHRADDDIYWEFFSPGSTHRSLVTYYRAYDGLRPDVACNFQKNFDNAWENARKGRERREQIPHREASQHGVSSPESGRGS